MNRTFIKKIISFALLPMMLLAVFAPIVRVSAWNSSYNMAYCDPNGTNPAQCPVGSTPGLPDYALFNSIVNHPNFGDERNFVRICEADIATDDKCIGNYVDEINIEVGKRYQVYVLFHNNAPESTNPLHASHNTLLQAMVPKTVNAGERTDLTSKILWDTEGSPDSTSWAQDEAYVTSSSLVDLRFYPGSAIIHRGASASGGDTALADSMFGSGVLIDSTNIANETERAGVVFACTGFEGFVTYRFTVDQPNFSIQKTVSADGTNFAETTTIRPGEEVKFKIVYTNTGTEDQENVNIKDELPAGLVYVPDSTYIVNPSNPDGLKLSDNITTDGVNIGNYGAGASAEVTFKAKAANKTNLVCGRNKLVNNAKAITDNGTMADTAEVEIVVSCAPDSGETTVRNAIVAGAAILALAVTAWLIGRRQTETK
jgi:uncharacterized repeat protein (TIGR01451 family)